MLSSLSSLFSLPSLHLFLTTCATSSTCPLHTTPAAPLAPSTQTLDTPTPSPLFLSFHCDLTVAPHGMHRSCMVTIQGSKHRIPTSSIPAPALLSDLHLSFPPRPSLSLTSIEGVMIAALNHTGCDTTSLDRVSAHQQRAHDEKIAAAMKCAKDQRDTRVEPMRYPSEASLTPLPEAFAAEHHTTSTTSPSPSSSSSSSRHRSTSKHVEHRQGQHNRVMIPPQASDASEVPLEAFAEGEVLEMDHLDDHGAWDRHHSSDPFTAQQLRYARARCSSSTLFDDARPSSGQDGSWTYQPKKDSMDLLPGSPAHAQHQQHPAHYRNTYDQLPKKQAIMFVDQATQQQGQPQQQPHHLLQQQHGFAYHRHGKRINDTVPSQAKTLTNGDSLSSTNSCGAESPTWAAGTRLKIEPSTPVRPASQGTHHSHDHSKGSSPLTAPTTPLTPTPAELDKPTKNLMIFNKIPRQWPASQETLHHNFVTKATKKTPVIKEFDSATAERIDRVINKERPLNRAAKERLAAEQKEAELEARGFFDPARRWKGRDAYPRPDNWVYCRRTKNNWLEKTKILVDSYKLFKGQVLGKGHHADVYKGVDLTTGQELAIKVIYKTVTRRLGFVNEDPMQEVKNRRLLNEAWFIDYLKDGPGICKMLRVVETATKFYFVMELAQSDLNSYSNGINMREEEIRHILRPIFECLKYAHSHDITHRDIKVIEQLTPQGLKHLWTLVNVLVLTFFFCLV
ncbi:hypothetical protein KVV02_004200 [Mortierella alpina]|uniref:Protein kinase domain-containing protein n=1 Tax=Mortierella alpina TaxID=64518 RepID=A0A9P8A0J0_MORAP|nr:hypothetical protein KVV02_004200 [Mortierella alpina]